jgi:hypothetical protein
LDSDPRSSSEQLRLTLLEVVRKRLSIGIPDIHLLGGF